MDWLQLAQLATIAIIASYTANFIFRRAYQRKENADVKQLTLINEKWKIKILPFSMLVVLTIVTELPPRAKLMLTFLLVIIFVYLPASTYLTPIESLLVKIYRPRLTPQLKVCDKQNNWDAVKLIGINSMLRQFLKRDVKYIGLIMIPTLKMTVPFADYTNDDVYQFGAGMLQPQSLASDDHLTIGAHNLGPLSNALFSPLARYQLYLQGMKVIIVSFKTVKEFEINRVQIIDDTDIQAALSGEKQTITLMTCTNDNQRRFLVHAVLIKEYSLATADDTIRQKVLAMQ